MFMLAFRGKETNVDRLIGRFGPLTLGMYAIHYLFELLLRPAGELLNPAAWEILFPVLVFSLSLVASKFLADSALAWTIGMRRAVIEGGVKADIPAKGINSAS